MHQGTLEKTTINTNQRNQVMVVGFKEISGQMQPIDIYQTNYVVWSSGYFTGLATRRSVVQFLLEEEKLSSFRFFFWREPLNPPLP